MPLIQVRVIKDVFSKEQKRQIIGKLTDAMVSIEGESMRGVTWCVVEEVDSGDWGIGGCAGSPGAWSRRWTAATGESAARR
jgi:4-oxalocrotonate tautomerase